MAKKHLVQGFILLFFNFCDTLLIMVDSFFEKTAPNALKATMNSGEKPSLQTKIRTAPEIIDLLAAAPSATPFKARVKALALSPILEKKILDEDGCLTGNSKRHRKAAILTIADEKELAGEVLRHRHLFTERLLGSARFRQAVLTVVQNIYLFKNRKIFFGTTSATAEKERQEALLLFSTSSHRTSIPLVKTFQHLIIARIWNRIISQSSPADYCNPEFSSLLEAVEKLNTLRNIYVLLTTGLVRKLSTRINHLYKQSITYEDAVQIGAIGIARAAYRYHPSSGVRFSTFAAHWVFREIQRQALEGRLMRISPNTVEGYARATRAENLGNLKKYSDVIETASSVDYNLGGDFATLACSALSSSPPSPVDAFEHVQLRQILLQTIEQVLCKKTADIIKRRFGLPPYQGKEQSILSICEVYKVTRSSVYQLEQTAFKKLQFHLQGLLL